MDTDLKNTDEKYYFSEHLENQLKKISQYPLTIVEAPSGFGKTTAIREYLNHKSSPISRRIWYTCLGESATKVWMGICDLLSQVDSSVAESLKKIDITQMDSLVDMSRLLKSMVCETETFLVIDNFQLVSEDVPELLIHFFSVHEMKHLHIILLTQQLPIRQQFYFHNENLNALDASDLLFDKECIVRYFRASGVRIKDEDIERINKNAAGWVAAVRLHLIHYKATGSYKKTEDLNELLKFAIWDKLEADEKNFLMSVALLDGFTPRQAAWLLGEDRLPDKMFSLLNENAFISYLPDDAFYLIHSLLRDFLINQFNQINDVKFQNERLKRAGEACLLVSNYQQAVQIFYQIEAYDSLLALPLRADYFNYEHERYLLEWIVRVVNQCPKEKLIQYPTSLVTFAFQFILFGKYEEFKYLCELLETVFEQPNDLSSDEIRMLKGELMFVQSFTAYNDVEKMVVYYQNAYELLGTASRFDLRGESWTFGAVSVLYMFWSQVGKLQTTLTCLDDSFPYYLKLARGHGTGGNEVMRAEAMLMKGFDVEAEVLCHKALYLARNKKQLSICLSAELVLARIAILRGDVESYQVAVESILLNLESPAANWEIKRMVALCLMTLSLGLEETETLPRWLSELDQYNQEMYPSIHSYGHMIYSKQLLIHKRYHELYALAPMFIECAKEMNCILPQVYQHIYLAVAMQAQGKIEDAKSSLLTALLMASPDEIFLPFAEHAGYILPILEQGDFSDIPMDRLQSIMTLCNRQQNGMQVIKKSLIKPSEQLTAREKEVAILAQEGLTVKQIAALLYISDATVKTILKSVYSKLEIHSKLELSKLKLKRDIKIPQMGYAKKNKPLYHMVWWFFLCKDSRVWSDERGNYDYTRSIRKN